MQNNGDCDQVQDLFQETLVVLLTALREPDFELTSSLKTYVFAISKNLWLKQLRTSSRWTGLNEADELNNVTAPVEIETPATPYESVLAIFAKLTLRCVTLLSAIFFGKKEMTSLVKDNNYASLHSAQNQKYKCLQQARKIGKNGKNA